MSCNVRDQCRSAGDLLRAGQGAEAQAAAEVAVTLAFASPSSTLEARAQSLLTRAWVAATTETRDLGIADCRAVLVLLAPPIEQSPDVIAPEVLIHLLAGVVRWSIATDHGVLTGPILERIKTLVAHHWGTDHPRYLLLSSMEANGLETMASGSMGLWHL